MQAVALMFQELLYLRLFTTQEFSTYSCCTHINLVITLLASWILACPDFKIGWSGCMMTPFPLVNG